MYLDLEGGGPRQRMTVEPRSGSPCPLDWPDPPAHPSYTSPAACPGHRHGCNFGSRPSATAHPPPPDTRPADTRPEAPPSVEKLDRLGTCLALMAPASFVALSCHTSVAGPPLTPLPPRIVDDAAPGSSPRRETYAPLGRGPPDQRQSPEVCFCMDGRRAAGSIAAEHDAHARHPQLRQVEAEHVGVVLVVGVQRQATVESRDRGQRTDHQVPPRASTSTPAGVARRPRRSEIRGGQPVATANLRPDLGLVRDVGPHDLVGNAEQVTH